MTLYESLVARALIVYGVLSSVALLVLSITEWCEHGALLTSAVMMVYLVWLAKRAADSLPDDIISSPSTSPIRTPWLGIGLGLFTLAVSTSKTHPNAFHVASSQAAKETYRRMEADPESQGTGIA